MDRITLKQAQIEDLRIRFATLPEDYLAYLSSFGWGETSTGKMIYNSPLESEEIFAKYQEDSDKALVLLGDDMAGQFLGYDLRKQRYVNVESDSSFDYLPGSYKVESFVEV